MTQFKEATVNRYKKLFDDAQQKLDSLPNFEILKKIDPPKPKELSPIPFPYGREGKTKLDFNSP